MATKFNYVDFNTYYTNIKDAVGALSDTSADTIGGVINSSNTTLASELEYAQGAAWASSKMNAWNDMYPGLVASFQKCINLLDVAKATCDDYQAFEQNNQNIRTS